MSETAPDPDLFDTITVTVVAGESKTKMVTLPAEDRPVAMGMRGSVARHYGYDPADIDEHATSIDYLVGAVVGCLTGTLAGRLTALGQPTGPDHLRAEGVGSLIKERGVLRVVAIHVIYHLVPDPDVASADLERAHASHQRYCPVASSVAAAIQLTSEFRTPRPVSPNSTD